MGTGGDEGTGFGDAEGAGLGDADGEGLGDGDGEGLGDGDGEGLGDGDGDTTGGGGVTGAQACAEDCSPSKVRVARFNNPVPFSPASSVQSAASLVIAADTFARTSMTKTCEAPPSMVWLLARTLSVAPSKPALAAGPPSTDTSATFSTEIPSPGAGVSLRS